MKERRIFLDSSYIIQHFQHAAAGVPATFLAMADEDAVPVFFTTGLVRLECLVRPRRKRNLELCWRYDKFFSACRLIDIGPPVIERALDLRAGSGPRQPALKALDALHLAAALEADCHEFRALDLGFQRFNNAFPQPLAIITQ